MNSKTNKQLDIIDEAIALISAAKKETYELTFDEALKIIQIQRMEDVALEVNNLRHYVVP